MPTRQNVILFGAGGHAKAYLGNVESISFNLLAVIDNDKLKQGTMFADGVPILDPKKIDNYQYDQIIIPHFLAFEMREELIGYGIDESKIVLPEKKLFKEILKNGNKQPFENKNTHTVATEITLSLASATRSKNIPLYIDWGTLLGVIRDGKIITWDDDVDLSAVESSYTDICLLIKKSKSNWENEFDCNFIINYSEVKIDIQVYSNKKTFLSFNIDIKFRKIVGGEAIQTSNGIWYTPSCHLENLDTFEWEKKNIYIPSDVSGYLTFLYGDWKTPKKEMNLDDYENHKLKM